MGCDYFHAQLSRLHLQAQHLHTRIKLVCGCCLFGFWDIVCVSAISSGSPTPWLTPALTGEQGRGLPACPHLPQRLRGRAAEETGRSSEMLSESSHTEHLEVQTTFQTRVKWSMCRKHPGTHQRSLWLSLPGSSLAGAVSTSTLHTPTQPCPAAGSPCSSFQASLMQLFIPNIFIFQKLYIFAHLSIITVRYAMLEHEFTLIICQLILRAYV